MVISCDHLTKIAEAYQISPSRGMSGKEDKNQSGTLQMRLPCSKNKPSLPLKYTRTPSGLRDLSLIHLRMQRNNTKAINQSYKNNHSKQMILRTSQTHRSDAGSLIPTCTAEVDSLRLRELTIATLAGLVQEWEENYLLLVMKPSALQKP